MFLCHHTKKCFFTGFINDAKLSSSGVILAMAYLIVGLVSAMVMKSPSAVFLCGSDRHMPLMQRSR
jgi:hypothetical protein